MRSFSFILISLISVHSLKSFAASKNTNTEIYCLIRSSGTSLDCQWVDSDGDKSLMKDNDIGIFIDQASVVGYVTVKSKAGLERMFEVDSNSEQFKKLSSMRKTASLSDLSKLKNDIFVEIEKKLIKLSDELDSKVSGMELVKYDPSIAFTKYQRDMKSINTELEGYRKNRETVCTATPAFEQISRVNSSLQKSLSSILYALQTPGTCMDSFKVYKDKDGTVDLRQLDSVPSTFLENCKKAPGK